MPTYDVTTTAGKVRLLISDVGGADSKSFIFSDDEIDAFLLMNSNRFFLAAAAALRTMAGNEAMVSKHIDFLDLSTDGPDVAEFLLKLADKLETQDDEGTVFEIAEWGVTDFARQEMRINAFLKEEG